MAGVWIVEMVIVALILLLIAKVVGVQSTGYSVATAVAVGGAIVLALNFYRK